LADIEPACRRRRRPDDLEVGPWRAPDGWSLRSFHRPAAGAPRGSLLFLGGRGDFFEKYLEAMEAWHRGGWALDGFDWRGQGGSGQLHEAGACHVEDFATFVRDLAAFAADWRGRTTRPQIVIGHSMGGHVLLRAAAEGLLSADALILLSPMLGIASRPLPQPLLPVLGQGARLPALRDRPLWSGSRSPKPGHLTSCPDRHEDKLWWKAQEPGLGRAGPTWTWLAAALRSIRRLDRDLRRSAPAMPILILAAEKDTIVDGKAIARTARRLPAARLHVIAGAGHELLRERDGPRDDAMARIATFLDSCA
jgi:lysophospholipase